MVRVNEHARALQLLFFRSFDTFGRERYAPRVLGVRVLVGNLQDAGAKDVARTRIGVLHQVGARVNAQARGSVVRRVVLVRAASGGGPPLVVLPFILRGTAMGVRHLFHLTVMSPRVIFRAIAIMFRSNDRVNERGRTAPGTMRVLYAPRDHGIDDFTVNVRILPTTVVAIAVYVRDQDGGTRAVFLVKQRMVRLRAATVGDVFRLFNCVNFIEQAVRRVPSPTRLLRVVVLGDRLEMDAHFRVEARACYLIL